MRRLRSLAPAVLLCVACRAPQLASGVSDSTFVATISALRRVPQLAPADSARRTAMRDSILRVHHVSREQMDEAARSLAKQPTRAKNVWDAIDRKSGTASTTSTVVTTPVVSVPPTPAATTPPGAALATPAAPGNGAPPATTPPAIPANAIRMQSVAPPATAASKTKPHEKP